VTTVAASLWDARFVARRATATTEISQIQSGAQSAPVAAVYNRRILLLLTAVPSRFLFLRRGWFTVGSRNDKDVEIKSQERLCVENRAIAPPIA